MKPIRITRLAPGEWHWHCSWCQKQDSLPTQPAAAALANAHYILAHWPPPPRSEPAPEELLHSINAG